MLAEPQKALIRQSICALREGVAGFRSRRAQLEMVAAVANALARCREEGEPPGEGGHLAVIEAGTGTGKSFGALVPALVVARTRGRRLVVSSATVALQHRYADKDVPALQGLLPFAFSVAVAKGAQALRLPSQAPHRGAGRGAGRSDARGRRGGCRHRPYHREPTARAGRCLACRALERRPRRASRTRRQQPVGAHHH